MPVFVGAGTSSFMKGSGGVGISTMTTTQRNALSGVKKGQFIFNETLNLAPVSYTHLTLPTKRIV